MSSPDPIRHFGRRMRARRSSATHHASRGVTLLELLVGISIGLLVVLAAMGTMLLSRGVSGTVSEVSRLQQQGAYAMRVIGLKLRQAGALDPQTKAPGSPVYAFPTSFPLVPGATSDISGQDGGTGASDTLSVAAFPTSLKDPTQPTQSYDRDCHGGGLASGNVDLATFTVNAKGELTCDSLNNAGAQALIADVAAFKVRYRVATPPSYVLMSAAQVNSAGAWGQVDAIEVCLDLRGRESVQDGGTTYHDCNNAAAARNSRTHVVIRTVFNLRLRVS